MALAQPGLPACWLEVRACEIHPHLSRRQAETPHEHTYLLDLALATSAAGMPVSIIPASLLIRLLSRSSLFRKSESIAPFRLDWIARLDPPPPRRLTSSYILDTLQIPDTSLILK
jgi:hypothetical protein